MDKWKTYNNKWNNGKPYGTVWYHMVPYGTIRYHMVPYATIWYHMVPLWYKPPPPNHDMRLWPPYLTTIFAVDTHYPGWTPGQIPNHDMGLPNHDICRWHCACRNARGLWEDYFLFQIREKLYFDWEGSQKNSCAMSQISAKMHFRWEGSDFLRLPAARIGPRTHPIMS